MNACLIVATLSLCTLVFAAVVWGVAALGAPLPLALVLVYLGVIIWMQGMQRRARGSYESTERRRGATARGERPPSRDDGSTADQRSSSGDLLHQS